MRNISPTPLHPQGSSRAVGGILRGRAYGNTFNYADQSGIEIDLLQPAWGRVKIYVSQADPATMIPTGMNVTTFIKCQVTNSLRPILEKITRIFAPLRRLFLFLFLLYDDLWSLKGDYEVAIVDDDDANWVRENNEYVLYML
ncbi:hypothetical protein BD779DRAFT_1449365, partial [Infundibulicybe gibba]